MEEMALLTVLFVSWVAVTEEAMLSKRVNIESDIGQTQV